MSPNSAAHQLKHVSPARFVAYGQNAGWLRIKNKREEVAVLRRPLDESSFDQIILPLDPSVDDYIERLADAIVRLAKINARTPQQIVTDLIDPAADVLRFRLDDPNTVDGTIPYLDGASLIHGAERSVRSSACSVVAPSRNHARLSRTESDLLLASAKLGQTERGSFITTMILPLDAVPTSKDDGQLSLFTSEKPPTFTRLTTVNLMRSISFLVDRIVSGSTSGIEKPAENGTQLSANLCDSLLEMRPHRGLATLDVSIAWDVATPLPQDVPQKIEISPLIFAGIEECAAILRPSVPAVPDRFVGTVSAAVGEPDENNLMAGDVIFQFQYEDELLKARVALLPKEYQIACDAHRDHTFVAVEGLLQRGTRSHRIDAARNFRHLA